MEGILKEIIRENIPKYATFEDMCWEQFTERINEESVVDLLQIIDFDKIMDFLEERKENYKGNSVIDVCNLYILVLAKEVKNKEFPKII
jgi:hypothetical protein